MTDDLKATIKEKTPTWLRQGAQLVGIALAAYFSMNNGQKSDDTKMTADSSKVIVQQLRDDIVMLIKLEGRSHEDFACEQENERNINQSQWQAITEIRQHLYKTRN